MAELDLDKCIKYIPNRFELCLCATYRARALAQGHQPKTNSNARSKPPVIALDEIGNGLIGREMLKKVPV